MPNVKNIVKTMKKQKIKQEIISQFENPAVNIESTIKFINKMEKLLTQEQCLSVMEEQGCSKTETITKPFWDFNQKHADKSLEEKIKLLSASGINHTIKYKINPDRTLSMFWGFKDNNGKYRCVCRKHKLIPDKTKIPLTYCGCCAGHVRYTHQIALGVSLHLKKIVSAPINSAGKNQCEFLFEVIEI